MHFVLKVLFLTLTCHSAPLLMFHFTCNNHKLCQECEHNCVFEIVLRLFSMFTVLIQERLPSSSAMIEFKNAPYNELPESYGWGLWYTGAALWRKLDCAGTDLKSQFAEADAKPLWIYSRGHGDSFRHTRPILFYIFLTIDKSHLKTKTYNFLICLYYEFFCLQLSVSGQLVPTGD